VSTNVASSTSPVSTSARSTPAATPNDGKPTETPTPGRPLLNHQRVLVYPKGYQCYKCHNTGYKAYDTSSPCRKCWERYAKPYAGAITYAPWTSPAPDTNYQKPLPLFRPPANNAHQRSLTISHQRSTSFAPPRSPSTRLSPVISSVQSQPAVRLGPQGNHLIVRPGDPRIGGRLCQRCFGSGTAPVFLFDDTCGSCGGVGRVFD